jgi:hypothetical protein
MTLEVRKLVGIILLSLLSSCGTKKKLAQSIEKKSYIVEKIEVNKKTDINSSTLINLDISKFKIIPRDTTQPVTISDSEGNQVTFTNTKYILLEQNKSVLRDTLIQSSSVGITTQIESSTIENIEVKSKEKEGFNFDKLYIYFFGFLFIYLIIRFIIKKYI